MILLLFSFTLKWKPMFKTKHVRRKYGVVCFHDTMPEATPFYVLLGDRGWGVKRQGGFAALKEFSACVHYLLLKIHIP